MNMPKTLSEMLQFLLDNDPDFKGNVTQFAKATNTRQSTVHRVYKNITKNVSDKTIIPWCEHYNLTVGQFRCYVPLPDGFIESLKYGSRAPEKKGMIDVSHLDKEGIEEVRRYADMVTLARNHAPADGQNSDQTSADFSKEVREKSKIDLANLLMKFVKMSPDEFRELQRLNPNVKVDDPKRQG